MDLNTLGGYVDIFVTKYETVTLDKAVSKILLTFWIKAFLDSEERISTDSSTLMLHGHPISHTIKYL